MANETTPIQIISNGDISCIPITVTNEAPNGQGVILNNVHVIVSTPDGLAYNAFTSTIGSYDPVTSTWTIGTLMPGQEVIGNLCFEVADDCKAPFNIAYSVYAATQGCNCETDIEDNDGCSTLNGISCCQIKKCLSTVVGGENITVDFDPDANEYTVNGYLTEYDPATNSLVINNPDGTDTIVPLNASTFVSNGDGTATHTSADGSTFTICEICPVLVDNGDGTYTFTNADGSIIEIGDTSVSTLVNNGDGTATYTDETGLVTVLDICQMIQDGGCLPTMVQDATTGVITFDDGFGNTSTATINEIDMDINNAVLNGSIITFTSEDGSTLDFDICAIVAANCNATMVLNPDGSVTHTDNAGTETIIPAPTPSSVVDNGDGTYTHSDGSGNDVVIDVCQCGLDGATVVENGDGSVTVTDGQGNAIDIDICGVVAADCNSTLVVNADGSLTYTDNAGNEVIVPAPIPSSVTDNGDGTYTHDDGAGNTTVIDVCQCGLDGATVVDNTDGTVTVTDGQGNAIDIDVCAAVAAGCNSTLTVNPDGSLTYVDNAGNTTTIPPAPPSTFADNGDGSFTHGDGQGNDVTISVCDLIADGFEDNGNVLVTGNKVLGPGCEIFELRLETVTVGTATDTDPNTNGEVTDPVEGDTYFGSDGVQWTYDADSGTWLSELSCCETLVTAPAITDPSDPSTIDCTQFNIGDTFYWAATGTAGPDNYDYKYTIASDGAGGCVTVIDDKPALIASVTESCECESCEGTQIAAVGNSIDADGNLVTNITDSDGNTISSTAVPIPCTCPDPEPIDTSAFCTTGISTITDHHGGQYVAAGCGADVLLARDMILTDDATIGHAVGGLALGNVAISQAQSDSHDADMVGVTNHHLNDITGSILCDANTEAATYLSENSGAYAGRATVISSLTSTSNNDRSTVLDSTGSNAFRRNNTIHSSINCDVGDAAQNAGNFASVMSSNASDTLTTYSSIIASQTSTNTRVARSLGSCNRNTIISAQTGIQTDTGTSSIVAGQDVSQDNELFQFAGGNQRVSSAVELGVLVGSRDADVIGGYQSGIYTSQGSAANGRILISGDKSVMMGSVIESGSTVIPLIEQNEAGIYTSASCQILGTGAGSNAILTSSGADILDGVGGVNTIIGSSADFQGTGRLNLNVVGTDAGVGGRTTLSGAFSGINLIGLMSRTIVPVQSYVTYNTRISMLDPWDESNVPAGQGALYVDRTDGNTVKWMA